MIKKQKVLDGYRDVQESLVAPSHAGFSMRLHEFIDLVEGLEIPGREERGRLSSIAKLTGHSKPSVSEWFKKDKLPSDDIFSALVRFFIQYIDTKESPIKIESWLRYGDEATPCPFEPNFASGDKSYLKDLALELLTNVVKEDSVSVGLTDLDLVLMDTMVMLSDYNVKESSAVPDIIYSLIRRFIRERSKA